jgi:hypothetical protein
MPLQLSTQVKSDPLTLSSNQAGHNAKQYNSSSLRDVHTDFPHEKDSLVVVQSIQNLRLRKPRSLLFGGSLGQRKQGGFSEAFSAEPPIPIIPPRTFSYFHFSVDHFQIAQFSPHNSLAEFFFLLKSSLAPLLFYKV